MGEIFYDFLDKESNIVKFGFNSHGLSLLYQFFDTLK